MADLRISPNSQSLGSPALTPAQPAGRAEAIKAAQRAFFNAALTQAQAQPEVKRPAVAASAAEPQTTRLNTTVIQDSAPPDRILRPGSLLDIKV